MPTPKGSVDSVPKTSLDSKESPIVQLSTELEATSIEGPSTGLSPEKRTSVDETPDVQGASAAQELHPLEESHEDDQPLNDGVKFEPLITLEANLRDDLDEKEGSEVQDNVAPGEVSR